MMRKTAPKKTTISKIGNTVKTNNKQPVGMEDANDHQRTTKITIRKTKGGPTLACNDATSNGNEHPQLCRTKTFSALDVSESVKEGKMKNPVTTSSTDPRLDNVNTRKRGADDILEGGEPSIYLKKKKSRPDDYDSDADTVEFVSPGHVNQVEVMNELETDQGNVNDDQQQREEEDMINMLCDDIFPQNADDFADLGDEIFQDKSVDDIMAASNKGEGNKINPFVLAKNEYLKNRFKPSLYGKIHSTKWTAVDNEAYSTYTIPNQGIVSHQVRVICEHDNPTKICIQEKYNNPKEPKVPKIEVTINEAKALTRAVEDVLTAQKVELPISRKVSIQQNGLNELVVSRDSDSPSDIYKMLTITQVYPEVTRKMEERLHATNPRGLAHYGRKNKVIITVPHTEHVALLDALQYAERFATFMERVADQRERSFLETARHFATMGQQKEKCTHHFKDYYNHVLYTFHTLPLPVEQMYPAYVVLGNFLETHKNEDFAVKL